MNGECNLKQEFLIVRKEEAQGERWKFWTTKGLMFFRLGC